MTIFSARKQNRCSYSRGEEVFVWFLFLIRGFRIFVITREETTIGRLSSAADVAIPFPTVSRLHAKLHCAQGICLLTNLNSCNGTYVNEIQLEGDIPVKLEDGDEIAFADIKYQFLEK